MPTFVYPNLSLNALGQAYIYSQYSATTKNVMPLLQLHAVSYMAYY